MANIIYITSVIIISNLAKEITQLINLSKDEKKQSYLVSLIV